MSSNGFNSLESSPPDEDEVGAAVNSTRNLSANVPFERAGQRLDQVAADLFPEFSRAKLQAAIKEGLLTLNGAQTKSKYRIGGGETLNLVVMEEPCGEWLPESIPLDIVYEDDDLLVVNKPAGLVVHPAAGNYTGTLLNGLLFYRPEQANIPRAGIVHRLDKDTSGVMVVAKTLTSQNNLVAQLQARTVKREYEAIAIGSISKAGSIDAPIGRHPSLRTKMAVISGGRQAVTHFTPLTCRHGLTHLRVKLETGRTHQIRVHMAHLGFPLLGDPVYGRSLSNKQLRELPESDAFKGFSRQALHAVQLGLEHPGSAEQRLWQVPVAPDMAKLLAHLSGFHDA